MKKIAYLSLGTNKGEREVYLAKAIKLLEKFGYVNKVSSYYETEPYGVKDQADFINLVLEYEHEHSPEKLLKIAKKIEQKLKRKTFFRWGPREIDIDIIWMEDVQIETKELTIPHKEFFKRNFVLQPLSEIAPNLYIYNVSIQTYITLCTDTSSVKKRV